MNTFLPLQCSLFAIALIITMTATAAKTPQEWQFIGEFESGDKQYIDMSSLKRERGYVRVRTMLNNKKPAWSVTSKNIRSVTGTDYIDCKGRRFMILALASYECPMANCNPKESASYAYDEKEFKPITNMSSRVGNVYNLVCQ